MTDQDPAAALKPCPFCGSEANIVTGDELAVAQCTMVKMHRIVVDGDNNAEAEVTEAWNRRASPPPAAALAEALKKLADRVDLGTAEYAREWDCCPSGAISTKEIRAALAAYEEGRGPPTANFHSVLSMCREAFESSPSWRFTDGPARNDLPVIAAELVLRHGRQSHAAALAEALKPLLDAVLNANALLHDYVEKGGEFSESATTTMSELAHGWDRVTTCLAAYSEGRSEAPLAADAARCDQCDRIYGVGDPGVEAVGSWPDQREFCPLCAHIAREQSAPSFDSQGRTSGEFRNYLEGMRTGRADALREAAEAADLAAEAADTLRSDCNDPAYEVAAVKLTELARRIRALDGGSHD